MTKFSFTLISAGSALMTLLFIAGRLAGLISWPWYWITSPIWIMFLIVLIVVSWVYGKV